jgi:hypothetical protein
MSTPSPIAKNEGKMVKKRFVLMRYSIAAIPEHSAMGIRKCYIRTPSGKPLGVFDERAEALRNGEELAEKFAMEMTRLGCRVLKVGNGVAWRCEGIVPNKTCDGNTHYVVSEHANGEVLDDEPPGLPEIRGILEIKKENDARQRQFQLERAKREVSRLERELLLAQGRAASLSMEDGDDDDDW